MRCLIRNFLHFFQRHRTLSAIAAVVFSCSLLYADTTWVAGDVYGVWDTTGSPFMVTDTITVPLDSTLEIRPGVEVQFLDQQISATQFIVLGRLLAVGTEQDSIYFRAVGGPFGGIHNQHTEGTEIHLEYCVIDSAWETITSFQGDSTVIRHSRIFGHRILLSYEENVIVSNNHFMPYLGSECWLEFSHCNTVCQHNQGSNVGLYFYFCQIAPIFDNSVSAMLISSGLPTEVYNNEIRNASSDYDYSYWHDNVIFGGFSIYEGNPTIEHSSITGAVSVYRGQAIIRGNEISGVVRLHDCNSTIQKNLLESTNFGMNYSIRIQENGNHLIQGNTIIFDDRGIEANNTNSQNLIIDNIFMGDGVNCIGVYGSSNAQFDIRYNDFYGVNTVTYQCELDTGNIFEDPLFRGGYPFDYQLQANSPCIDAGDPTSPSDPDSTRADMGVYYYDQLIDQPPALISPVVVNVQEGTFLRYVAQATDDNGPLQFGFWDLPPWLNEEILDWVADSAAVSGDVPYDQADFTFGVWVEDGLSQRDSQEVSVLVSPYTILSGDVTGVLTVEGSPYLVVEDVVVPVGDHLTIDPGVEIRFQWHPVSDLRHRILVRGTLYAVGTTEDTIYFLPEYGDSLALAWCGIQCIGDSLDTTRIGYAYITNGYYGVVSDSGAQVIVDHTIINDTKYGITIVNDSWVGVDSCQFYVEHPYFNYFINTEGASVTVTYCHSEYLVPYQYGTHFSIRSGSEGSIQGCTFVGGSSGHFNMYSYGDFIGNRMINLSGGLGFGNYSSGIASNNIFVGGDGIYIYGGDSVLISNNVFHSLETGVSFTGIREGLYLKNNIFQSNECGVFTYSSSPPFTNISYNDFFDNDSDFVNCVPDSTNIYLDPIVQDTIDFRLSLGSPCIDTGDPDPFFNDPDSTRNDIGCWGGPWGESYPYSPVLSQLSKSMPDEFTLLPPYPNPFNSVLVVPFTIPHQAEVKITIYNILGQRVDQFDFFPVSPGAHRVVWNSGSCASGIYLVRMNAKGQEYNQKVVLLK